MRRALANWASHALRGAHAEYVDSSAIRWLATSAKQNIAGTPPRPAKSPRQKRYSAEDTVGVKSKLYSIMKAASQPLSSAEIWENAEPLGVRSKRFMKLMLQNMKSNRHIKTIKTGKGTQFGYILPENMNPKGKGVPWPKPTVDLSAAQQEQQQESA